MEPYSGDDNEYMAACSSLRVVSRRSKKSTYIQLLSLALGVAKPALAQVPFYTDDPAVTERGKWHFEFSNELDALQHSHYPNLNQNTTNFKLNYGLPYNLELGLEGPYLTIFRAVGTQSSTGVGDAGIGVKSNSHKESQGSRLPALGASLYIQFSTGDTRQQLGSGLLDSSLNFIAQHSFSDKTWITGNVGVEFAGNTSTGLIGIQTTRGQVYTGGLSLFARFQRPADAWG